MNISIREERMSDAFTKYHIEGLPFAAVLHRFTAPDTGDFHDHPWPFFSVILKGGYVEEVFGKSFGVHYTQAHQIGDRFWVGSEHTHRIVRLLDDGECWTLILPQPGPTRTSRFWQFRPDGAWSRAWHETEWTKEK